jgi:hypothetical protein
MGAAVSRRKSPHKVTVRKCNPFGTGRMWWAVCTCPWFQGNHHKQDSERMAAGHLEKMREKGTEDDRG